MTAPPGPSWDRYTHEELYAMTTTGAAKRAAQDAEDVWVEMRVRLSVVEQDLTRAIGAAGAHWEGRAADAATAGTTPLGRWALDAVDRSRATHAALNDQGEYALHTMHHMPPPRHTQLSAESPSGTDVVPEVVLDWGARDRERANDAARARELMGAYQANSETNTIALAAWEPVPQVVAEVGPAPTSGTVGPAAAGGGASVPGPGTPGPGGAVGGSAVGGAGSAGAGPGAVVPGAAWGPTGGGAPVPGAAPRGAGPVGAGAGAGAGVGPGAGAGAGAGVGPGAGAGAGAGVGRAGAGSGAGTGPGRAGAGSAPGAAAPGSVAPGAGGPGVVGSGPAGSAGPAPTGPRPPTAPGRGGPDPAAGPGRGAPTGPPRLFAPPPPPSEGWRDVVRRHGGPADTGAPGGPRGGPPGTEPAPPRGAAGPGAEPGGQRAVPPRAAGTAAAAPHPGAVPLGAGAATGQDATTRRRAPYLVEDTGVFDVEPYWVPPVLLPDDHPDAEHHEERYGPGRGTR